MAEKASLIMPVKNEAANIGSLIEAIFAQERKPDELVIVDAGSSDGTKEIIKKYFGRSLPIKLIETKHAFPGEGRNIAVKNATFPLIAMIDAGLKIKSDWLKELLRPFEENPSLGGVFGVFCFKPENFMEKIFASCFVMKNTDAYRETAEDNIVFVCPATASLAIRKEAFEKIGGFNASLRMAEDGAFFEEIKKLRINIAISKKAKIYHSVTVVNFRQLFGRCYCNAKYVVLSGSNSLMRKELSYLPFNIVLAALTCLILSIFLHRPIFMAMIIFYGILRLFHRVRIIHKFSTLEGIFCFKGVLLIAFSMLTVDSAAVLGYLAGLLGRR